MVGLFSASTAFLLRQVVLYDVTNLCEDGPLRLSCSFDVLLLFVELIFAMDFNFDHIADIGRMKAAGAFC